MFARYGIAGGLGLVVTFGLFMLMRSLIAMGSAVLDDKLGGGQIEFVRLKEDSDIREKKRELPKHKKPEDAPPPPEMSMPDLDSASSDGVAISAPPVNTNMDMSGGPSLGMASDADVIPLVRVRPMYPRGALTQGIEGYVVVEFTIDPTGKPTNVKVVDAQPPNIFNQSAKRAVVKWKYNPKVEDGKAVERHGVRTKLEFSIPKDQQ